MSLLTENGSIGIGFATLLGPVMAVARSEMCTSAEVLLVRTLAGRGCSNFCFPGRTVSNSPRVLLQNLARPPVQRSDQLRDRRRHIARVVEELDRRAGRNRDLDIEDDNPRADACCERYRLVRQTKHRPDVKVNGVDVGEIEGDV